MVLMIDVKDCKDINTKEDIDIRSINAEEICQLGKMNYNNMTLVVFKNGSGILTKTSIKTIEARIENGKEALNGNDIEQINKALKEFNGDK